MGEQGRCDALGVRREASIQSWESQRRRSGNQDRWRSEGSRGRKGARGCPSSESRGVGRTCKAASESRRRGPRGGKPRRAEAVARRVMGTGAQRGKSQAENSSRGVKERSPNPEVLKRDCISTGARGSATGRVPRREKGLVTEDRAKSCRDSRGQGQTR
eukprot:scaffold1266_cov156-Cylindrotheca_fusiformis.AAC.2